MINDHFPTLLMNTDLAAQRALDRLDRSGFAALTEADKTLAAAWLIEAEVNNNGFAHFFASPRGNVALHAPPALQAIGATRLAEIAAEANSVFGLAGPPPDHATRRTHVRAFGETTQRALEVLADRYCACSEDVDELLEVFLTRQTDRVRKKGAP